MLPNVSPNSSLKYGPTTPAGRVWRMSPTFLRAWYHSAGMSRECIESFATNCTSDSPGREYERMNSYSPVSISFFSMRSLTWRPTCSAVAPGQNVRTTMILNVNGGSSDWPSFW